MSQPERKHRRHRVADMQGTLRFAYPATVVDLSRSGVAVETFEELVPGREYPLQIEGPDGLLVTSLGRVVWCKPTGTQVSEDGSSAAVYRAGLQLEEGLPEPAVQLLDRLEQAAVDDGLAEVGDATWRRRG